MQDRERLSRTRSNLKEQESYSFETVIYRKQRQSAVSSNYQTGMRILNEMFQNKKIFLEIREVGGNEKMSGSRFGSFASPGRGAYRKCMGKNQGQQRGAGGGCLF